MMNILVIDDDREIIDSIAMQKVLRHYTACIYSFSKDEGGINYATADEIKSHLLQAILKFNIRHD